MRLLHAAVVLAATTLLVSPDAPERSKGGGEVAIFNWYNYIPDDVRDDFSRETGIRLVYDEYDSNETMVTKLFAGARYDVAFPSQDFVPIMIQKGLLVEIDKGQIANLSNVDQNVMAATRSFDPDEAYTVPFNVGATAIVYWKDKIKDPAPSFGLFADPRYRGKVILIDDPREVFGAALHNLGFSGNSNDENEIARAAELIRRWKANGQEFNIDAATQRFLDRKAWAAFTYPENIVSQLDDDQRANVGVLFPQEGGMKYQDSMVVLKSGKNRENAYVFIDFMLRPDIQARIDDAYGYPGIESAANALRKTAPYYTNALLDGYEFRLPLGDKGDLYTDTWDGIKGR